MKNKTFRYNPDHLATLEKYVEIQSRENAYDLEANLAVLKLYQLNPHRFNMDITCQILLKALTNLPHTDFVLCKCLLSERIVSYQFGCYVLIKNIFNINMFLFTIIILIKHNLNLKTQI